MTLLPLGTVIIISESAKRTEIDDHGHCEVYKCQLSCEIIYF